MDILDSIIGLIRNKQFNLNHQHCIARRQE